VRLVGLACCNLRAARPTRALSAIMRQSGGTHAASGELFRWSIRKISDYND
jgi:hypothetical protein